MRALILMAGLVLAAALVASNALGAGFFHSVRDPDTKRECGACHMAYPPSLLPARSWARIIGHLDSHFGENASMAEPTRARILAFMTQNAGDSGLANGWFMRGVPVSATPARITDMPFWRSIHGAFPVNSFKRPGVKKAGNCIGCHG